MFIIKVTNFYLILLAIFNKVNSNENNACKNFVDYNSGSNCYFNPDVSSNASEILKRYTSNYESYEVTTEDGYILTLFRIPQKNAKGVVILQHSLASDSVIWMGQSNESLAFLMFDAGYDVWLPNNRGTEYSQKHINLTIDDFEYWDFSFHEIGLYDLSSTIQFIKNVTQRSDLIFIGHSMSTTSSLIYASLKPDEAKNSIKVLIEMCPVAYFKNVVDTPFTYTVPLLPILKSVMQQFKIGAFLQYRSLSTFRRIVPKLPIKKIFVNIISYFYGWTPNEYNPEFINLMLTQNPRGTSWKIVYHYNQQFNSGGRFQFYDYGSKKNMELYSSDQPPEYPVSKISVPVYLIYSSNDTTSTVKDAEMLYENLSESAKIYGKLRVDGINHIDFHYGIHRKELIYKKIFALLDKIL